MECTALGRMCQGTDAKSPEAETVVISGGRPVPGRGVMQTVWEMVIGPGIKLSVGDTKNGRETKTVVWVHQVMLF